MTEEQRKVREFHLKYGVTVGHRPMALHANSLLLRSRLICEEAAEFVTAASQGDIVGQADALGDLLYVVYGAAVALGIDLEPIFNEVHKSNMTKSLAQDSGGKITKGNTYIPPDILRELITQGQLKQEEINNVSK